MYTVKLANNDFYYVVETDSGKYYDITNYAIYNHVDSSVPQQPTRLEVSYAKALIGLSRAYTKFEAARKAAGIKQFNLDLEAEV